MVIDSSYEPTPLKFMIEYGQVIAGLEGQHTAHLVLRVMYQLLAGIAMKKEAMDSIYVHPMISGKL
jgi:hypothetical protein